MAMLLQETAKSASQCEGYLCGEINVEQTSNITDSEVRDETEEIMSINDVLACTPGSLNLELVMNDSYELDSCLSGREVLGWYRFCRRPLLSLSLREKFIHRKLSQRLSNGGYRGQFITILLQEDWNSEKSTHSWQFVAYSLQGSRFQPCPIEIVNLKKVVCGVYKPFPSVHQMKRLPSATSTLSLLEQRFTSSPATKKESFLVVDAVRDASKNFDKSLHQIVSRLASTEIKLKSALDHQKSLKIQELQLEESLKRLNEEEICSSVSDLSKSSSSLLEEDTVDIDPHQSFQSCLES